MITIEKEFSQGYIRPVARGIVLYDDPDSLGDDLEILIEKEIRKAIKCDSFSSGIELKGVKIKIVVEEAKKK